MSARQSGAERAEVGATVAKFDEFDHAGWAADHLLSLVVAADPTFRVTPQMHDETVALVQAMVSALVVGRSS